MKRSPTPPGTLGNGALGSLSRELGKGSAVMLSAAVLELPSPGARGPPPYEGTTLSEAQLTEGKSGGTVKVYLPNQQRTVCSNYLAHCLSLARSLSVCRWRVCWLAVTRSLWLAHSRCLSVAH
ncbi:hypothetical protein FKM82_022077 [Ascaphus truei]